MHDVHMGSRGDTRHLMGYVSGLTHWWQPLSGSGKISGLVTSGESSERAKLSCDRSFRGQWLLSCNLLDRPSHAVRPVRRGATLSAFAAHGSSTEMAISECFDIGYGPDFGNFPEFSTQSRGVRILRFCMPS